MLFFSFDFPPSPHADCTPFESVPDEHPFDALPAYRSPNEFRFSFSKSISLRAPNSTPIRSRQAPATVWRTTGDLSMNQPGVPTRPSTCFCSPKQETRFSLPPFVRSALL